MEVYVAFMPHQAFVAFIGFEGQGNFIGEARLSWRKGDLGAKGTGEEQGNKQNELFFHGC